MKRKHVWNPITLGHQVTRRNKYGWRTGKIGWNKRRPFLRAIECRTRPLLAFERRTPCTCGACGAFCRNGIDNHDCPGWED